MSNEGGLSPSSLSLTAQPLVEGDCGEDKKADIDILVEGVDAQQVGAISEDGDKKPAQNRSADATFAAGEGSAADNNCRHHIEFVTIAAGRIA